MWLIEQLKNFFEYKAEMQIKRAAALALPPLHQAVIDNNLSDFHVYAYKYREELNKQDTKGKTAFHYAVELERKDMVRKLLEYKYLDINIQDMKGKTALDYALELKQLETIKDLLQCKHINLNIQNGDDKTFTDKIQNYLTEQNNEEIADLLGNMHISH